MLTLEQSCEIIIVYACLKGSLGLQYLHMIIGFESMKCIGTFTNDSSSVEYLFRWGCHELQGKQFTNQCFDQQQMSKSSLYFQIKWQFKVNGIQGCACMVKITFIFLPLFLSMPWWDHISQSLYSQSYLLFTSNLFNNAGGVWVSSERSKHLNYTTAI